MIHPRSCNAKSNFYPRSPCGERQDSLTDDVSTGGISIHALLAESDKRMHLFLSTLPDFYPRSPCGERLAAICKALSAELYFYPRSPCGERR